MKICKQKFEAMDVSESIALFDSKLKKFLTEQVYVCVCNTCTHTCTHTQSLLCKAQLS